MSETLHDLICLELAKLLKNQSPVGLVGLYYEHPRGEIDVYKRFVENKAGLWIADYEVKSHDCPRSREKALDQLARSKQYWHNAKDAFMVDSFFVFSERNEDKFSVVPVLGHELDFKKKKSYDLRS